MKLLFVTPQLPFPPRQGTALRNWGLIRHLAGRHTICLMSFAAPDEPVGAPLAAACADVRTVPPPHRTRIDRLRTLLSYEADLGRRLWSPAFAAGLTEFVRQHRPDVVQFEGLEMAPYLRRIEPGVFRVYDAHNAEYLIQQRALGTDLRKPERWPGALYSWVQLSRLRRFEAQVCRAVDAVACVSDADAAALARLAPGVRPVVVPNGLAIADYDQAATPAADRLVFSGKMDYRPNADAAEWFVDEILPRLRAARPAVEFHIVGQRPGARLRRRHGQGGVVVVGAVEDARPHLAGAAVYVAPLRMGGGTRFKLLEAMALRRPIVSTTLGAEGFDVRAGRELLLADHPAEFAARVLEVLGDAGLARALGAAGRAFVEAGYDWRAILPRLESIYAPVRPG